MKNTITNIINTAKNILLVAMIAGIASFIAGVHYEASAAAGHIAPVSTTAPTSK